jgi:PTS system fructose-specific IIA component/PTS system nitrogen regulatory IIA component
MKFSDFIVMPAIKADLAAEDKRDVIAELIHSLVEAGVVKPADQDGIVAAVMRREELGSTGIGRGVAVPHTKHPSVERLIGTVGISAEGVNFNSLDGAKVHLFFLIISPHDRPSDHLRALEQITMHLRDDAFCRFLKQARTVPDLQQLLEEADANQFST